MYLNFVLLYVNSSVSVGVSNFPHCGAAAWPRRADLQRGTSVAARATNGNSVVSHTPCVSTETVVSADGSCALGSHSAEISQRVSVATCSVI